MLGRFLMDSGITSFPDSLRDKLFRDIFEKLDVS